jgi:predicted solute-binding protein
MVFGVFAARKDTPILEVKTAQKELLKSLDLFESSEEYRDSVITEAMVKSGLSRPRLEKYFGEVFNRLDKPHIEGLNEFLSKACNVPSGAEFLE